MMHRLATSSSTKAVLMAAKQHKQQQPKTKWLVPNTLELLSLPFPELMHRNSFFIQEY
jgi:hypothetical protein